MLSAELPEKFWQEECKCAGHVYNWMVCAHPETHPYSPFEVMFGVKPHTFHFQPWGFAAFSKIPVKRNDHTSRGKLCLFMGYNDRYHVGYRLYNIRKKDF